MTEKEKMLAGEVYSAIAPELIAELQTTREVLYEFNSLRPSDTQRMKDILKGLLGHVADDKFIINQPFHCDYGKQISIGKRFFSNFNFTVLDEAYVTIGDDCFIGPNVSIYTACHSTDPVERNSRQEWAKPVTIGHNVWREIFDFSEDAVLLVLASEKFSEADYIRNHDEFLASLKENK